jgi:hypothetical protein
VKKRGLGTLPLRDLQAVSAKVKPISDLPLVHITAVGAARDVVSTGIMETRACPHFNVDLIYFFLGRPAYRLRNGDIKAEEINYFPFAFIVEPKGLDVPYHVYPFDTGGALGDIFKDREDEYVYLEDYALKNDLQTAAKHIAWAFGTASSYIDGDLKQGLSDDKSTWEDTIRSFVNVARMASSTHNKPDSRASAVEVAYRLPVRIKDNVKFVILPKQYLEDKGKKNVNFIAALKHAGIRWDTYDWQPNTVPNELSREIAGLVKRYYRNRRIL